MGRPGIPCGHHSSFPVTVDEAGFVTADGTTTQRLELGVFGRIVALESTHDYLPTDLVAACDLDELSAAYVKLATGEASFSYLFKAWVDTQVDGTEVISMSNFGTIKRKSAKRWNTR